MKMRSYARRNALLPRGASAVALAVAALAAAAIILRVAAPGAFVAAAAPVWRLANAASAGTRALSGYVSGPVKLSRALDGARAENTALANENATLAARVQDLEALLGTRKDAAPGILAGVLGRPPASGYDSLVVDEGSAAGVLSGALVRGAGGVPLGTIASATQNSARVALYSTPGAATSVWVGDERIALTMTGAGAGAFEASADREAEVKEGDAVYAAGPGAVALGRVVRIDSDPSSPSVMLRIQSAVNPFSITWVTIDRSL